MYISIQRSLKQKGISLLELLLSIVIIMILGFIAVRYYQSSQQNQNINSTLSLLSGFIAAEAQWSSQNKNKYSHDIESLTSNHYLSYQSTINPWTGQQIVYEQMNKGNNFKITLYNIKSPKVCKKLANSINDNIERGKAFCKSATLSFISSSR
jgi:type II secretory pathway pseudopilin PulG